MTTASKTIPSFIHTVLPSGKWAKEKERNERRISGLIDDYVEKRRQHHKDPVIDFLFEYYAFRPSHLKRWSPGFGVFLEEDGETGRPDLSELRVSREGSYLNPDFFPDNRKDSVRWILQMLQRSTSANPVFGCFGMHEWAMVYKKDPGNVRHIQYPLRMGKEELAEFVESRPLVCTHFDAYRFFSEPARPLNRFALSREKFSEMEQPGCLHTNMDLYKWSFKLYPWISSNTIRRAFELALEARIIDMKASPYDLRGRGLEPIRIETEQGRDKYMEEQKNIFRKSQPVRAQLIKEYRNLADFFDC